MTAWCALAVRLISVSIFRSWGGSVLWETEAESLVTGLCADFFSNNWKVLWLMVWKQSEASVHSSLFLVIRKALVTTQMCFLLLLNGLQGSELAPWLFLPFLSPVSVFTKLQMMGNWRASSEYRSTEVGIFQQAFLHIGLLHVSGWWMISLQFCLLHIDSYTGSDGKHFVYFILTSFQFSLVCKLGGAVLNRCCLLWFIGVGTSVITTLGQRVSLVCSVKCQFQV